MTKRWRCEEFLILHCTFSIYPLGIHLIFYVPTYKSVKSFMHICGFALFVSLCYLIITLVSYGVGTYVLYCFDIALKIIKKHVMRRSDSSILVNRIFFFVGLSVTFMHVSCHFFVEFECPILIFVHSEA